MKIGFKSGTANPCEVLQDVPWYAEKMRIDQFLKAIPRFGPRRTNHLLKVMQINPIRGIGELTPNQRARISDTIKERQCK